MPLVLLLLLLCTHSTSVAAQGDWKFALLPTEGGAVCLDGSPGGYYIRGPLPGTTPSPGSWLVYFEGGGWCLGLENCWERGNSSLGSSTTWPRTLPPNVLAPGVSYEGAALFSSPPFSSFTIVYAKYCDGSSWTADNATVSVSTHGPVYFRGARLLSALVGSLNAAGLSQASTVLFSGCSAGAGTLYFHLDALAAQMPPGALVLGLGDAMFALDHPAFPPAASNHVTDMFSWGYSAFNASSHLNADCVASHAPQLAWKCMLGGVTAAYTRTPLMVVNSRFDVWQAVAVLGLNATDCPGTVNASTGAITLCQPGHAAEEAFWGAYGDAMSAALAALPPRHGAFFTNCPTHCQTGIGWAYPSTAGGLTLGQAVAAWWGAAAQHAREPGWVAPRFLAVDGDQCPGYAAERCRG